MSEQSNDSRDRADAAEPGITDEQLPEDLRPTDDNPLAKDPEDLDDAELSGGPAKEHGAPGLGEATS